MATASDFCKLLQKSGLFSQDELAAFSQEKENSAKELARKLLAEGKLTRWQASQLLAGRYQLTLGQYRLLDILGEGAMGRLYLGEHKQLERKVAIKVLSRRFTSDPATLAQFKSEASKIASLDHRNLIHVLDIDTEANRYFLVMEHVTGKNLAELVQQEGPLSIRAAMECMRQAAAGLEHLHEKGLYHGHVRPTNLILDAGKVVKVVGVGMSRLVESASAPVSASDSNITAADTEYVAPEVDAGGEVNGAADVFSLGCSLYFLLTGKVPFSENADPRKLKAVRKDVSDAIAKLVARMTSRNVENRPAMSDVHAKLAVWFERNPESASTVPVAAIPAKSSRWAEEESKDSAAGRKPPVRKKAEAVLPVAQEIAVAASPPGKGSRADSPGISTADNAAAEISSLPVFGKKSTGPAAKPTNKPAVAPAATAAESNAGKKKGPPLALLIGGGIGALALVLLVVGGLSYFLFFSGEEEPVAEAADKENSEVALRDDEGAPKPINRDDEGSSPKPPEEPEIAEPPPEEPDPPAEPPVEPEPQPEPEPEPPPAEPEPEPEPPEVQPEPETQPEPEAPQADPEPLRDFAKAVTLPDISVADPAVLGPAYIDQQSLLFIDLLGGEVAFDRYGFSLEAKGDTAWNVSVGKAGENAAVVARFLLEEKQLKFQWAPGAAENTAAPYLCNCLLRLRSNNSLVVTALRTPVEFPAPVLDFELGGRLEFKLPHLPAEEALTVEILGLEGSFPAPQNYQPGQAIAANKGETLIVMGDAPATSAIQVRSTFRRSVTVQFIPYFTVASEKAPVMFKLKLAQASSNRAQAMLDNAERQLAPFNSLNEQQKNQVRARFAPFESQKEAAILAMQQFEGLSQVYTDLHQKGQINVQLTYKVDDHTVVLATTSAAPVDEEAQE